MKVLDLQCAHAHRFEGWFASVEAFEDQLQRKLVTCPVCGADQVSRVPSAPRLNLSSSTESRAPVAPEAWQGQALRVLRQIIQNTENVGERFAEEARRIHYNEAPARGIRGTATPEDTQALAEEGIDVLPLPLPEALKEPLQ
jgi:hypothetical protein